MRTSERIAVGAVIAMVLPAFLVFPALGVAYVVRVWPGLGLLERCVFLLSVAMTCVTVPLVFRRRLDLVFRGQTERLSLLEQFLVAAPVIAGGWALTHQWLMVAVLAGAKSLIWSFKIIDETSEALPPSASIARLEDRHIRPRRGGRVRRWMRRRRWATWIEELLGRV